MSGSQPGVAGDVDAGASLGRRDIAGRTFEAITLDDDVTIWIKPGERVTGITRKLH